MSESRSLLTGRIVDSYTNILTVKLFARAREEDAYVREALEQHTGRFHRSLRLNTLFSFSLTTLNACWSPPPAGSPICSGRKGASRSAPSRWRCRSPGRSSACRAGSPTR
jgi:ATP-binding cassette subfamily B multidrug efflux pump